MESGKKFDPAIKTAIAIALTFVIAFSLGNILGASKNITVKNISSNNGIVNTGGTVAASTTTAAPTVTPVETTAPTTGTEPASEIPTGTTAPTTSGSTTNATTSAPAKTGAQLSSSSSKAEIISYFNESANKIKTSAKSVTRNYEDLRKDSLNVNNNKILEGIGNGLMNMFLKKNETPEVYDTKEAIIANYPVHGETFVSKATEADVASAQVQDDGTYYTITLKFNAFNGVMQPDIGTGVASAFNYMKYDDVMDAAGKYIKENGYTVDYFDGVIVAKVEKATGNMVSANYTLPMVMNVDTSIGINASVGMTFNHDYTIEY